MESFYVFLMSIFFGVIFSVIFVSLKRFVEAREKEEEIHSRCINERFEIAHQAIHNQSQNIIAVRDKLDNLIKELQNEKRITLIHEDSKKLRASGNKRCTDEG